METEVYKHYKKAWEKRINEEERNLEKRRDLLMKKVRVSALKL